jgi:hypothetical protein
MVPAKQERQKRIPKSSTELNRQNGTGRKGKTERDRLNGTGRTGQAEQER